MASNITVSGLVVAPGVQQSYAQWEVDDPNVNGLPYLQLDRVELWAHTSNDRSGASKVAEGITFANHVYTGLNPLYYWIRARDKEGQYGDWYPSSSTAGIEPGGVWQDFSGSVTLAASTGSITSYSIPEARYFKLGPNVTFTISAIITNNGTGSGYLTFTLPVDANYFPIIGIQDGSIALVGNVYLTEGRLYKYDGSYPGGAVELSWGGTYEAA